MLGGSKSSGGVIDASRIFNDGNADIQQMNRLIHQHMVNMQQQFTGTGQTKAQVPRYADPVNKFDATPSPSNVGQFEGRSK